jgi:C1A family cysteine protease
VLAIFLTGAVFAWAVDQAPINPDFQQYQQQLRAKALTARTADGHGLGFIPHPTRLPAPAVALPKAQRQALPSSYDLRTYGKVTAVQDQGEYGNCWTFATFASMESCLLTGATWNFSENNLANKHGLDNGYGDGGNSYMSLAYLGRWAGPVLEADDPYSNGPNSPSGLTVQKHVQSAVFVPDRTAFTDNDLIKQAIMTYGALYTTMYWGNTYYNSANAAYYYNGSSVGNHAVTIVGWDDTYSRTKFGTTPAGDGAFLVKNSWGTSWGSAGYFWASYYDTKFGLYNCLFVNAEATSNYDSVYQYDPLGYCTSFGYGSTTSYGANIFSGASGSIEAVSFYAMAAGSSYEIRVYTGGSEGAPTSGTLSATKTGSATYAGYYTVVLDSPVSYSGRFSVVVKFTTPGFNYPIPCEYRMSGYSSAATASAGESYISSNGTSWEEAKDGSTYFNICIKAFGTGGEAPGPTPPGPVSSGTPLLGDYDGDRLGDPVFYRSSSVWNLLLSSGGYSYLSFQFGGSGYLAMPGDFDGDGVQDPTVYVEATGLWYMMCSRFGYDLYYIPQPWGGSAYTMQCGDYDGDRYADPMMYLESTGYWYILSSSHDYEAYYATWWGGSGYSPVTCDFDGDRYSDLIAYNRSAGNWYVLLSSSGEQSYYPISGFGGSGYTPVAGDFDGDRLADLVAFNASSFTWNILLSSTGWRQYISAVWNGSATVGAGLETPAK